MDGKTDGDVIFLIFVHSRCYFAARHERSVIPLITSKLDATEPISPR